MAAPPRRKRTPRQARAAIGRLDLAKIVDKAIKLHGWTRARARASDEWYRRHLWLCYKYGPPIAAIGKDADELWHLHILDTRKYAADCRAVFGAFLNHTPIYGQPTAHDISVFDQTKAIYQKEYGTLPIKLIHVSHSSHSS
jgi:hypothetical protein